MKRPTMAEAGRFILIILGVLLIEKLARVALFDGQGESLRGLDVVIAIAVGVLVMGGWLRRANPNP